MNIGILTLVPYDNYGGILQGYALQTVLERLGHHVIIMNTKLYNYVPFKRIFVNSIKWYILKYFFGRKDLENHSPLFIWLHQGYRVSDLKPFINKYIHLTRTFKDGTKDILNYTRKKKIDIFVVGSDQVWRPELSPDLFHMFCDFLPEKSSIKRIAYAASFGTNKLTYTPTQLKICKNLLQKFNAVGVRESSGIKICHDFFNVNAIHVLDPTLLLTKKDYVKLITNYKPIHRKIDFMQYLFWNNNTEKEIIKKVSGIIGLTPTNLFPSKFLSDVDEKKDLHNAKFLPLEEWLYGYYKSKFVITDSFHGTVFCIIFNKPFIVISPEAKTRIESLLNDFNLTDRLVYKVEDVTPELIKTKIDWESVNRILTERKNKSLNFITSNIY